MLSTPPSLLEGVDIPFLSGVWSGRLGVLFRDEIFFHFMVGGDGVVGPKELVDVATVIDGRA